MSEIKTGKLTPTQLDQLVFSHLGYKRDDVLVHAGFGEDSAVIDFGEEVCVVSSDPITGAVDNLGELALHISCNDVAANGARPLGIQTVLLFPAGSRAEDINQVATELDQAAREMGIEILGGHTEVTDSVKSPVVVVTALGRARSDNYVTSAGAKTGDDIILTKSAGLEGASILASDFAPLLRERGVEEPAIAAARDFARDISIVPEAMLAAERGTSAMHDVTEGGVCGALYEMAKASGAGMEIWREEIPVAEPTAAICRALGLNPLSLISSGALLISAPSEHNIAGALREEGIKATVIGRVTTGDEVILTGARGSKILTEPPRDELWGFLEQN